jgi:hypothetical protein
MARNCNLSAQSAPLLEGGRAPEASPPWPPAQESLGPLPNESAPDFPRRSGRMRRHAPLAPFLYGDALGLRLLSASARGGGPAPPSAAPTKPALEMAATPFIAASRRGVCRRGSGPAKPAAGSSGQPNHPISAPMPGDPPPRQAREGRDSGDVAVSDSGASSDSSLSASSARRIAPASGSLMAGSFASIIPSSASSSGGSSGRTRDSFGGSSKRILASTAITWREGVDRVRVAVHVSTSPRVRARRWRRRHSWCLPRPSRPREHRRRSPWARDRTHAPGSRCP